MAPMRAMSPGLQPRGDNVTLDVAGTRVVAQAGDTVAAALVDAGLLRCRIAADGDVRGVFCGMGVCFECRMIIDGIPHSKSCQILVQPDMDIRTDE